MQSKKSSHNDEWVALQEVLLQKHSKAQRIQTLQWIYEEKYSIETLMHLFLYGEHKVAGRAAASVNDVAEKHPEHIERYLSGIVDRLHNENATDAIKRNGMRLLQFIAFPSELHGKIMDISFRFLLNPRESIAVRVFSIIVLKRLSQDYPEIIPELKSILENILENRPSAGLKSRALKTLQEFH